MTTIYQAVAVVVLVALGCGVVGTPRAYAMDDWVKVLGGAALGYVAAKALDDDGQECRSYGYMPDRRERPAPRDVYRRYDPPSRWERGGSPREYYNQGYKDGFRDGTDYGYGEGWQDGKRIGYRQGYRTGYRNGYDDGFYHSDGPGWGPPPGRPRGRW